MNIINAYNENGIYFLFDSILWWFNGKRCENWCYCPHIHHQIFVYNNNLYGEVTFDKVHILENRQFKNCKLMKEIFKTEHYVNPFAICLDNNHNFYFYSQMHGTLQKNGKLLPNRVFPHSGLKLLYYDGFLYHFSFSFKNEKFDIQKNQWSLFSNTIYSIMDIYLLNDLFYTLFRNGKIGTYNPRTNVWKILHISLEGMKTIL